MRFHPPGNLARAAKRLSAVQADRAAMLGQADAFVVVS